MYNKYIINRLLLWDSEEPACVGGCFFLFVWFFFFCLLFLVWPYGGGWTWTSLLRRVLVLLCAPAAEVHPPQVVPVCYPVVGTQSAASAVRRGVPAHRTWEGTEGVEVMEESGWRENRAGGKWVWLRAVRAAGDCSGLRSRCLSVSATGSSDCARTRPLIRFVLIIQPFFFVTN